MRGTVVAMWSTADELLAWLAGQPPAAAVRIARLLADTKTAGALREYADDVVYGMTRDASYSDVEKALDQTHKQVMKAVQRKKARLAA